MVGRVSPQSVVCGPMPMRREGRYWLFFVIVAVGLVLSWGQIGRKTHRVLGADPIQLLATEQPCSPATAPCAALGGDRALVLGPGSAGLRLRTAGFDADSLAVRELQFISPSGDRLATRELPVLPDDWVLDAIPKDTVVLRIRLQASGEAATVAEFPLRQ